MKISAWFSTVVLVIVGCSNTYYLLIRGGFTKQLKGAISTVLTQQSCTELEKESGTCCPGTAVSFRLLSHIFWDDAS